MEYFVTVRGDIKGDSLSLAASKKMAKKLLGTECGLHVGIGHRSTKKGKKVFTLLPASFYL